MNPPCLFLVIILVHLITFSACTGDYETEYEGSGEIVTDHGKVHVQVIPDDNSLIPDSLITETSESPKDSDKLIPASQNVVNKAVSVSTVVFIVVPIIAGILFLTVIIAAVLLIRKRGQKKAAERNSDIIPSSPIYKGDISYRININNKMQNQENCEKMPV